MVGDDIVGDIGGAKACGLVGVQVRTGKYRLVFVIIIYNILHVLYFNPQWFYSFLAHLRFILRCAIKSAYLFARHPS